MHHELLRTASLILIYKEGDIRELGLRNQLLALSYSIGLFEAAVNCVSDTLDFHSPTRRVFNQAHKKEFL